MVTNPQVAFLNSKVLLIDIGGTNIRTASAEVGSSELLNANKKNLKTNRIDILYATLNHVERGNKGAPIIYIKPERIMATMERKPWELFRKKNVVENFIFYGHQCAFSMDSTTSLPEKNSGHRL